MLALKRLLKQVTLTMLTLLYLADKQRYAKAWRGLVKVSFNVNFQRRKPDFPKKYLI